jgi:hypothetical protein
LQIMEVKMCSALFQDLKFLVCGVLEIFQTNFNRFTSVCTMYSTYSVIAIGFLTFDFVMDVQYMYCTLVHCWECRTYCTLLGMSTILYTVGNPPNQFC